MSKKITRYCSFSYKKCSLTYGSAPCTASIGVTGDFKCYNTPRTCQDPANYSAASGSVSFCEAGGENSIDLLSIPSITSITRRPQQIRPGESLGVRESVTITFANHKHNDVGFDDYPNDRTGNPYDKGTFWGKFFARNGSLEGQQLLLFDQAIKNGDKVFENISYYMIDSVSGPDSEGRVSIVAKDIIKFFDNKKAQAPNPSVGELLNSITDVQLNAVLSPAGIGDAEYPTSGVMSIGDERMTFTRVGDNLTLANRGSSGTSSESHDAGETVQLALVYDADDIATILDDLISNYTDTPSIYVNLSQWQEEVANYLPRLYSAEIMRPTSVKTLIDELISEVGLVFYTDVSSRNLVLKAFRSLPPTTEITDDVVLQGSLRNKKLTNRRVDRIWIYYGKFNPLQEQSQRKNYKSVYVESSADPIVALEESPPAIRDVLSRWIKTGALSTVEDLANNILTRYQTAPREFSFAVPDSYPVKLGEAVSIQSRLYENPEGDLEAPFSGQVTSAEQRQGFIYAVAEEVPEGIEADPIRIVQIDSDTLNVNLRTLHDTLYQPATSGDTVRLIVSPGAIVGSISTVSPALSIGAWPAGVIVEIGGTGRIQGKGGDGTLQGGEIGGLALFASYACEIIDDIEIFSGGGAGPTSETPTNPTKYAGGGGGAGSRPGFTGGLEDNDFQSTAATTEAGGVVIASTTSEGGGPGLDSPSVGGALAGNAIDGVSNVTIDAGATPDIRGYQVG